MKEKITIDGSKGEGGTHVPFAPVWDFFAETYLPELRRMGARVEAELEQCGFYPAAGGVVRLRVWPYDESKKPDRYELTDIGAYKGGVVKAMEGIVCERWGKYRGYGKAKGRLDLSEAPQAYKDIEDVIASERDLVKPLVRLVPLASLKG